MNWQDAIHDINMQLIELKFFKDYYKGDIIDNANNIIVMKHNITTILGDLHEVCRRNDTLNETLSGWITCVKKLEVEINELKKQNAELKEAINIKELIETVRELKKENAALKKSKK